MNKLAQVNINSAFNSPFGQTGTEGRNIGSLISIILNVSFAVSGVIILFMLVYAGIMMIQGAGSGKSDSAEKAKQAASSAAIGFVIIFIAYWIVRLIEVITGSQFITAPNL